MEEFQQFRFSEEDEEDCHEWLEIITEDFAKMLNIGNDNEEKFTILIKEINESIEELKQVNQDKG